MAFSITEFNRGLADDKKVLTIAERLLTLIKPDGYVFMILMSCYPIPSARV